MCFHFFSPTNVQRCKEPSLSFQKCMRTLNSCIPKIQGPNCILIQIRMLSCKTHLLTYSLYNIPKSCYFFSPFLSILLLNLCPLCAGTTLRSVQIRMFTYSDSAPDYIYRINTPQRCNKMSHNPFVPRNTVIHAPLRVTE